MGLGPSAGPAIPAGGGGRPGALGQQVAKVGPGRSPARSKSRKGHRRYKQGLVALVEKVVFPTCWEPPARAEQVGPPKLRRMGRVKAQSLCNPREPCFSISRDPRGPVGLGQGPPGVVNQGAVVAERPFFPFDRRQRGSVPRALSSAVPGRRSPRRRRRRH